MPRHHRSKHETSAEHAGPQAVLAYRGDTAAAVRARIRQLQRTTWDLVCVVDHDGHLLGSLTAAELLSLADDAELTAVAGRNGVSVLPGTDQELMASTALHHGVSAMPVVDEAGRLAGVVGPTTLMDILRREHVEDLHRLAGITRESSHARKARDQLNSDPRPLRSESADRVTFRVTRPVQFLEDEHRRGGARFVK